MTWTTLADVTVGTPYGHVPGHDFLDVTARIERRGAKYRVTITEERGHAQGRSDDVNHRARVVAIDTDLDAAVRIANSRAQTARLDEGQMVQALSQAHAEAVDAEEEVRTTTDINDEFEAMIPESLRHDPRFIGLSFAEMANEPEFEAWADDLRRMDDEWWAAEADSTVVRA